MAHEPRVVIVTGGSRGLGAGIVRSYLDSGDLVTGFEDFARIHAGGFAENVDGGFGLSFDADDHVLDLEVILVAAFAPFGEGFPAGAGWLLAGCTLTVAGAAGVCTAVGACANAAADRSMSVPRFRMI